MKKSAPFDWPQQLDELVKTSEFSDTIAACERLLEQVNCLIPSTTMRSIKLTLTLTVDLLRTCKKQIFRVAQLHRRGWL